MSLITSPITVWHIIEHKKQQFDTYHHGKVPITDNQLGAHAMGHEVAVVSGHHYPQVNASDFTANYVAGSIQYTFPWDEGQILNSWLTIPEVCHISSHEAESNLLPIVS